MATLRQVKCPTCGAPVAWAESSRYRPFCSERCRTTDLGAWAAGRHRIAGEPADGTSPPGAEASPDSAEGKS
jgi:hypothetical protein